MTYEELLKLLSKPRWLDPHTETFLMGSPYICVHCYRGFAYSNMLDIPFEDNTVCPVRDELLMQWSRMRLAQFRARR